MPMNNPILVIDVGDIIALILGSILLFGCGLLWLLEKLFGEEEEK